MGKANIHKNATRSKRSTVKGLWRTRIDDGKVISCNTAFAKLLGYSNVDEVLADGQALKHYLSSGERTKFLNALKKHGQLLNYILPLRRIDGSEFTAKITAFLYDKEGVLEGSIEVVTKDQPDA